jgi:iron(II)-dependent oxidoreductase
MNEKYAKRIFWGVVAATALSFIVGWATNTPKLLGLGGVGLVFLTFQLYLARRGESRFQRMLPVATQTFSAPPPPEAKKSAPRGSVDVTIDPKNPQALVDQMLGQGRYALLLRAQIIANLSPEQLAETREALEENSSFVPEGEVVLGAVDDALADGKLEDHEIMARRAAVVHVEPYFLDRFPVTNREYYEFIAAGGYEELPIWEKEIWPAMVEFVDETGQPGPKHWRDGHYPVGEENFPVVGINWFEASAYARWVGKRLPTDAEWVKAGAWPVALTRTARFQRKYPWGNTMQASRANLWGSGPGRTVAVDATPGGVSVGGVHQLIGNTWEWTASRFVGQHDDDDGRWSPANSLRSVRGGAFDTYFENQATCQFQSGENPVHRRHNIGFRCAVALSDLAPEVTQYLTGSGEDDFADEDLDTEAHDTAESTAEVTA